MSISMVNAVVEKEVVGGDVRSENVIAVFENPYDAYNYSVLLNKRKNTPRLCGSYEYITKTLEKKVEIEL